MKTPEEYQETLLAEGEKKVRQEIFEHRLFIYLGVHFACILGALAWLFLVTPDFNPGTTEMKNMMWFPVILIIILLVALVTGLPVHLAKDIKIKEGDSFKQKLANQYWFALSKKSVSYDEEVKKKRARIVKAIEQNTSLERQNKELMDRLETELDELYAENKMVTKLLAEYVK